MPIDMLERLRTDPGHRTLGELLQDRQWAVQEIERLRAASAAPSSARRLGRPFNVVRGAVSQRVTGPPTAPPSPHQMLRLPEVSTMACARAASLPPPFKLISVTVGVAAALTTFTMISPLG